MSLQGAYARTRRAALSPAETVAIVRLNGLTAPSAAWRDLAKPAPRTTLHLGGDAATTLSPALKGLTGLQTIDLGLGGTRLSETPAGVSGLTALEVKHIPAPAPLAFHVSPGDPFLDRFRSSLR